MSTNASKLANDLVMRLCWYAAKLVLGYFKALFLEQQEDDLG